MKTKYLICPALLLLAPVMLAAQDQGGRGAFAELAAERLKNDASETQAPAKTELKAEAVRLTKRERDLKTAAIALAAQPAKSGVELEIPEYCRINDKDLNAMVEAVMTRESPREPLHNNLFIELAAATPAGKTIRAKVINVLNAHPGDQFHIEVYVAGKLLFKSGRQDNPIFIGFQVDNVPYSLTCFEDIQ